MRVDPAIERGWARHSRPRTSSFLNYQTYEKLSGMETFVPTDVCTIQAAIADWERRLTLLELKQNDAEHAAIEKRIAAIEAT